MLIAERIGYGWGRKEGSTLFILIPVIQWYSTIGKHRLPISLVLISLIVITSCNDSTVADVDAKSATAADSSTFDLSMAEAIVNENNAKFTEKFAMATLPA
jgi:hypothetical protein